MKTLQRFIFASVAALVSLPIVSSCSEDDPINSRCPSVNKNQFIFSQEGGVDTLYLTDKEKYEVHNITLVERDTRNPLLEAYMSKGDTAFVNSKNELVGKVSYKGGTLLSLETEWYSVHRDESYKDLRYIVQAHPSKDTYEMELLLTIKNGGLAVRLVRE